MFEVDGPDDEQVHGRSGASNLRARVVSRASDPTTGEEVRHHGARHVQGRPEVLVEHGGEPMLICSLRSSVPYIGGRWER